MSLISKTTSAGFGAPNRRGRGHRSLRSLTVGVTVGVMVLAGGFFQPNLLPAQAAPVDIATPGIYAPTVTFQDDDATIAVQQVTPGQFVAAPVLPSHDGEVFDGWWDESADPAVSFDITATPITADITLTAHFKTAEHLVSFMMNTNDDGDYAVWKSYSVPDGQSLDDIGVTAEALDFPDTLAPAGTFFTGEWVTSDNEAVALNTVVTSDLTLYPEFDNGFYVFFESGGTPVPPQVVLAGGKATEPNADPAVLKLAGYTFDGWYTEAACAGRGFEDSDWPTSCVQYVFSTEVKSTITLYGRWLAGPANYQVVYWCEKPNLNPVATNFTFDPGTNFANYDYVMSDSLTALSGTIFPADDRVTRELSAAGMTTAQTAYPAMKYAEFYTTSAAKVAGDGSTIINVFYKRLVYELAFRINSSAAATLVHDDVTYGGDRITTQAVVTGNDYIFYAKAEQDVNGAWPKPSETSRSGYYSGSWSQPATSALLNAQSPNFNLYAQSPGYIVLTSGSTVNFLDPQTVDRASLDTTADGYHLLIFSMDVQWGANPSATFSRLTYFQATNTELGEIKDWVAAGNTVRQWNEPWNLWCDRTWPAGYDDYAVCDDQEIFDYEHNVYPPYLEFDGNYYVYRPEQIQRVYTSPLYYYGIGYPSAVGLTHAGVENTPNGWSMIPQTPWYTRITTTGDFTAATFTAGVIDTRNAPVITSARAGDYTLYNNSWWAFALFNRDPATINFNTAGGKAPALTAEQKALRFGDTIGEVDDPKPPQDGQSYEFEGWFIDPTFQIAFDPSMTMPVGGLTLFAEWQLNPVTVSFFAAPGESVAAGETTVAQGGQVAEAKAPVVTAPAGDAEFLGWFLRDEASGYWMAYDWSQPVLQDTSLYARWQPVLSSAGVIYRGNDNTAGEVPSDGTTYLAGNSARLLAGTGLERGGAQFIGWQAADDLYYPGDLVEVPANGLELTAQYGAAGPAPVTVKFNANTGEATPPVVTWDGVVGATVVWPGNTDVGFSREGFAFLGWSTDAAAKTADPAYDRLSQAELTADVTLYGVWVALPDAIQVPVNPPSPPVNPPSPPVNPPSPPVNPPTPPVNPPSPPVNPPNPPVNPPTPPVNPPSPPVNPPTPPVEPPVEPPVVPVEPPVAPAELPAEPPAEPVAAPQTTTVQTGGQPVTGGWGWVWLMAAGGLLATGWGLGRLRLPVLRG